MQNLSPETQCVHTGTQFDAQTQGVNTPIYTSSAYGYLNGVRLYPRYYNLPNQKAVVEKLCALEQAESGLLFASGMAAISTSILALVKKGEHIVFQNNLYGGTHYFVTSDLEKYGIEFSLVEGMNPEDYAKAIKPNTRLMYIETPTNPLLKVIDLQAIADICKANNLVSMIDNTFASPINQNPIKFGIDVVMHSATKYLGGHSDMCAGAIVSSAKIMERIYHTAINFGGNMDSQTCYLLERSMKTLALRVERQNANALKLVEFLGKQPEIAQVYYPSFDKIAHKQMKGFGGMLSFELKTLDSQDFMKRLKLVFPALSLGGVESTICTPYNTSHLKISQAERDRLGIKNSLLRFSVGIEEVQDIMRDLEQALG